MSDNTCICLPPVLLGALWPQVAPKLLTGIAASIDDPEELEPTFRKAVDAVFDGLAQLWAIFNEEPRPHVRAVFITRIVVDEDGRKVVDAIALSGEGIKEWGGPVSDQMTEFARAEGCEAVSFCGRRALIRVYNDVTLIGERPDGLAIFERTVH